MTPTVSSHESPVSMYSDGQGDLALLAELAKTRLGTNTHVSQQD